MARTGSRLPSAMGNPDGDDIATANGMPGGMINISTRMGRSQLLSAMEFPVVFNGEWAMHNGVQVPVANRSWLVPVVVNICLPLTWVDGVAIWIKMYI
ncbi:MAG TPA: hypothetical protein VJ440_00840 [Candidatus Brocadiaceae bacterium]|nr:hypothetical protein [Candidatus Brocadiaceae bacterium]